MLELLIKLLQATLEANGPYQNVYSLATLVTEQNQVYPAVYCTNGDFKTLGPSENYVYFRQNGKVRRTDSVENSVSACGDLITVTYPFFCVGYIPKDLYNSDNNFAEDKISQNLANFIQLTNLSVLYPVLKPDDMRIEVVDIETDREVIWKREYKGVEMAARHDHVYCSISFNIILEISESCLQNFDCNMIDVVINGTTIDISISSTDVNAWHKDGDTVTETKSIGTISNHDFAIKTNNVVRWTFAKDGNLIPESTHNIGSVLNPVGTIYVNNIVSPSVHPAVTIGSPANGLSIDPVTQVLTITAASTGTIGVVTTGAQSFSGIKTFVASPIINTLTAGFLPYAGATKNLLDSGIFYDSVTGMVGIGIASGLAAKVNVVATNMRGSVVTYTYTATGNNDTGDRLTATITGIASGGAGHNIHGSIRTYNVNASAISQTLIGSREDVVFGMNGFGPNIITKLITSNGTINYQQYNNSTIPFTNTTSGLNVGLNGSSAVFLGRSGVDFILFTNGAVAGTVTLAQNWGIGGSFTPLARLHTRGALNGSAFYADTSTGAKYVQFREVAGVRQIGFNDATPIPRPLLPSSASASDIANVLDSLGLTRLL